MCPEEYLKAILMVIVYNQAGKISHYNVLTSGKHECWCPRMSSYAVPNPLQIEVSRAVGGCLFV